MVWYTFKENIRGLCDGCGSYKDISRWESTDGKKHGRQLCTMCKMSETADLRRLLGIKDKED
jgi:hypothetical protein